MTRFTTRIVRSLVAWCRKTKSTLCTPGVSSSAGLGWPRRPSRSTHPWTSWLASDTPLRALRSSSSGLGLPAYAPRMNWKRVGMRSSSWKHIRDVSAGACTRSDSGRANMGSSAPCASPRSTLCLGIMPGALGSRSADSYKPIPWLSISYVGTVYVGRTQLGSDPSTSYRPQSVTKRSPTYGRKPCSAN